MNPIFPWLCFFVFHFSLCIFESLLIIFSIHFHLEVWLLAWLLASLLTLIYIFFILPFLSVPTTLRRTRWMCAISHPTLNCWKLVWWFPWSLAVWLLLMAVFQPVENHCFSEPLLIMWVCCLWRLIIDPVSYKKEAVISPKGQGHHWSLGAGSPMLPYLWGEYMLGAKLAKSWIIAAVAVFILNTKNQTLF